MCRQSWGAGVLELQQDMSFRAFQDGRKQSVEREGTGWACGCRLGYLERSPITYLLLRHVHVSQILPGMPEGSRFRTCRVTLLLDAEGTRSTPVPGSCTSTHGAGHSWQLLHSESPEPHHGPFGKYPETCPPGKTTLAKRNVGSPSPKSLRGKHMVGCLLLKSWRLDGGSQS